MGLILIIIGVGILCGILAYWVTNEKICFQGWFIGIVICGIIIIGISSVITYGNYISLKEYKATMEQNKTAINFYMNNATLKFENDKNIEFTDLKYNEYQKELSNMIKGLVYVIKKYNSTLTRQRILKNNFIFGLFITAPDDDMQIIEMKDYMKIN